MIRKDEEKFYLMIVGLSNVTVTRLTIEQKCSTSFGTVNCRTNFIATKQGLRTNKKEEVPLLEVDY